MTGVLRSPGMITVHAHPTDPAARPALDEMLRRKVDGLTDASAGGHGDQPSVDLFAAQVRQFADAVDAAGGDVPYEDAVVLIGTGEPVVVHIRDYEATPGYWQTVAAGSADPLILDGHDVMRALST